MESQGSGNLFPKIIKDIRSRNGWTQAELGKAFDPPIAYQSVGQWERGENAPARRLWPKFAELLGLDMVRFYEYLETGIIPKSSHLEEILQRIQYLTPEDLQVVTTFAAEKWGELEEGQPKANPQHIALLEQGKDAWNNWRQENPQIKPSLYKVNLESFDFGCPQGELGVNLMDADLRGASLNRTNLSSANLRRANLSEANLQRANLSYANLEDANLTGANLAGANLRWAFLFRTNFERAILKNCSVYGVSVWDAKLDGAKQSKLDISDDGRVNSYNPLYISHLELAQTIYLFHKDIRYYQAVQTYFQEEREAEVYARHLVWEYGRDEEDGSRLYSDSKEGIYQITENKDALKVLAPDREQPLVLQVIDNKFHSNLLPDDLDKFKVLCQFERSKRESSEQDSEQR